MHRPVPTPSLIHIWTMLIKHLIQTNKKPSPHFKGQESTKVNKVLACRYGKYIAEDKQAYAREKE